MGLVSRVKMKGLDLNQNVIDKRFIWAKKYSHWTDQDW